MSDKTIQSLAKELSRAFVTNKRNDGQEYVHLKEGSPEWMTEVVRAIHGDKLPDDTTYRFIERCADAIADAGDDPTEAIYSMEADIYTSDLTAWLHARNDHVFYLDEALSEDAPKSGFDLLYAAQKRQIEEIGSALVSELEARVTETEPA
jgi:hypothetical protein